MLVLIVGIAFWGRERLPVQHALARVGQARDQLASMLRPPDLPGAVSTPAAPRRALVTRAPSATPPATVAAVMPTAALSATAVMTPTTTPVTSTVTADPTRPAATETATSAPTATETPAPTETATPTPTATEAPPPTATPTAAASAQQYYTVRAGDSLIVIGQRTGFPWQQIAQLNGLNQYSSLQVGQKLKLPLPGNTPAGPTAAPAASTTYKVQPGDTLAVIGTKLGIPWQTIADANHLTGSSMLQVGQELIIPGKTSLVVPTATAPAVAVAEPAAAPAPVYPAPALAGPGDQASFSGENSIIELQWGAVPGLPTGSQYEVKVDWTSNGAAQQYAWHTPLTSTGVPSWLWLRADQPARRYLWAVRAVNMTTDGKGGEVAIGVSPQSEIRTFYWN
jgi:LysM repeat protein